MPRTLNVPLMLQDSRSQPELCFAHKQLSFSQVPAYRASLLRRAARISPLGSIVTPVTLGRIEGLVFTQDKMTRGTARVTLRNQSFGLLLICEGKPSLGVGVDGRGVALGSIKAAGKDPIVGVRCYGLEDAGELGLDAAGGFGGFNGSSHGG